MRDEIDGRLWVEHGADFTAFLGEVIDSIRFSFERLAAIEFDAPWRRTKGQCR